MKFQEIDFHIELLKASLEPKGTKIDYLEMLRKESKFKRDVFLIKLETAFDNIQKAYQSEVFKQKSFIVNWEGEFDLQIPFYFFNRYPILANFSKSFDGQFDKNVLAQMEELVNDLGIYYKFKEIAKTLKEISSKQSIGSNSKNESNPFESIWLKKPKVSTDDFLKKGIDLGLWDENYNLLTKRGAIYGSRKTLLANISIALKNHSINGDIDYKIIGEVFCSFFKIEIKNSSNPYKAFQAGNEKQIKLLKKVFE